MGNGGKTNDQMLKLGRNQAKLVANGKPLPSKKGSGK
jgi:hypothetical protein